MSSPTLSFNSSNNDYVQTPFQSNFGTSSFSVGGWVKSNAFPNGRRAIVSTYDANNGWILGYSGGEYRFWTTDNNDISGGNVTTGVWHHLVGSRNSNGNLTLYLDGELIGTGTSTSNVDSSADVQLGKEPHSTAYNLDGELDDVRVFDRGLTQDDVQTFMNGEVIGNELSHWPLNEGTGTVATNATDRNHDGTINGATWSERSGGNTYSWSEISDWDNSQEEDDVNHSFGTSSNANDGSILKIGQEPTQLTTTSEDAYYVGFAEEAVQTANLTDSSPANNHSITNNNVTYWVEDGTKFVRVFDFNGTDSYVELPSNVQSSGGVIGTELWFYPRSRGDNTLFDSSGFYRISYDREGNRGIRVAGYGDGITSNETGLSLDTWHHVNFYWNTGTEFGLSINGNTRKRVSTNDGIENYNNPKYLGRTNTGGSSYFDGRMTNIRFVTGQGIDIDESLYQTNGSLLTGMKP